MKIVVSDPVFLPEEYRKRLEVLGNLTIFENMPSSIDEFISRVEDADIVIVGRYGFSEKVFHAAKNLKMISVWQTGYDHINIKAATEKGIVVSNVPDYAYDSVAEMVFALILNLARKVHLQIWDYVMEISIGVTISVSSLWVKQ